MTRNNCEERFAFFNDNESNVKFSSRINWRASLVPAAAVIPAPIAYIKVVAVKKLVVELLVGVTRPLGECPLFAVCCLWPSFSFLYGKGSFTVKKLECSKQKVCLEYVSME